MPLWGLTGGIASGKSTVHGMLATLGAEVIDADAIYHELLEPEAGVASPLAQRIENRYPGVVGEDGVLDRKQLGERVFSDASERRVLEQLTHPAVAEAVGDRMQQLRSRGVQHIFYDVPLLYERGLDKGMDGVIVVWVSRDTQVSRLMQRDHLSREQTELRLSAQLPLNNKRDRAQWVIDNSGSLAATEQQVQALWRQLTEREVLSNGGAPSPLEAPAEP